LDTTVGKERFGKGPKKTRHAIKKKRASEPGSGGVLARFFPGGGSPAATSGKERNVRRSQNLGGRASKNDRAGKKRGDWTTSGRWDGASTGGKNFQKGEITLLGPPVKPALEGPGARPQRGGNWRGGNRKKSTLRVKRNQWATGVGRPLFGEKKQEAAGGRWGIRVRGLEGRNSRVQRHNGKK